jgi:hypothetical protein
MENQLHIIKEFKNEISKRIRNKWHYDNQTLGETSSKELEELYASYESKVKSMVDKHKHLEQSSGSSQIHPNAAKHLNMLKVQFNAEEDTKIKEDMISLSQDFKATVERNIKDRWFVNPQIVVSASNEFNALFKDVYARLNTSIATEKNKENMSKGFRPIHPAALKHAETLRNY